MARHPSDPVLNQIAADAGAFRFDGDPTIHGLTTSLWSGEPKPQRITLLQDMRTFAVRLYLGGKNRTLVLTKDPETAYRWADVIAMHFWPYRIRAAYEPNHADLNYSPERAKADLGNPGAQALLKLMHERLVFMCVLLAPEKLEAARQEDRKSRDQKRTRGYERYQMHEQLRESIAALDHKLDAILGYLRPPEPQCESPAKLP